MFSFVMILGCAGGPEATEAEHYVETMTPTLLQNSTLAQRFLTEASRVKKKEVDGGKLAEVLTKELVPQAAELARSVAAITPVEPRLSAAHAVLVKAWSDRSTAYSSLAAAWAAGDLAAWDAALRQNTLSKLDEERYFAEINGVIGEWNLSLTQYPAAQ
jgi:hypothetical protein